MTKLHPLKIERQRRGWSQGTIAKALEVTTRTVIRWEQGETIPYPYYRERLVTLFGKNMSELGLLPNDKAQMSTPSRQPLPLSPLLFDPFIPEAPGDASRLLGRDALLAQIKQRILKNENENNSLALTALNGLPGIGKTALAVALATDRAVQEHYHDGILWAGLGPHPNVLHLLTHWGSLLRIRATDVENANSQASWWRALHATIGSRKMLLIIDDAWSTEAALALQVGGSNCAHLLTTRLPFVAFAFAQQDTIAVPELEETDGLALLARFVPQLVEQDEQAARELVRSVGGLPLAVKLMGYYLASQGLSRQPRRLQNAFASLHDAQRRLEVSMPSKWKDTLSGLAEGASLSLQAVIAISAQHLSKPAHAMLHTLTIFPSKPNSFSEEAATAIGQEPVETLDELWESGLLEASGPGRYTLHQTIVDYIRLQGDDQGSLQQRLVQYMPGYVQEHELDYASLRIELNNIEEALDLAIKLDLQQEFMQMVQAIIPFLRIQGLYLSADTYLQQAQKIVEASGDQAKNAFILSQLGTFAELRGDSAQAERYGQLGLALARQHGLEEIVSALLDTLGLVAFSRGEYPEAKRLYTEALEIARNSNDTERTTTLLCHLGEAMRSQGDYQQAEGCFREGLHLARQYEYQELSSRLLASLGQVIYRQGNLAQAIAYMQEGLTLAQHLGHRQMTSMLLAHLGTISLTQGALPAAKAYFQEALLLNRQIGHRDQICGLLLTLATLSATLEEDYPQAERYAMEGIELARQGELYDRLTLLLSTAGFARGYQGDYEQANLLCSEGIELARRQGAAYALGWSLTSWAEIHLLFDQRDAAAALCEETLKLSEEVKLGMDMQIVAKAQFLLGKVLALRGDFAQARQLGNKAIAILERGRHFKLVEVKAWMAQLPASDETSQPS
jgi:tetratricopeptide (TPR) repeat protein/transcriptional regulator with XRE-family HTH domain